MPFKFWLEVVKWIKYVTDRVRGSNSRSATVTCGRHNSITVQLVAMPELVWHLFQCHPIFTAKIADLPVPCNGLQWGYGTGPPPCFKPIVKKRRVLFIIRIVVLNTDRYENGHSTDRLKRSGRKWDCTQSVKGSWQSCTKTSYDFCQRWLMLKMTGHFDCRWRLRHCAGNTVTTPHPLRYQTWVPRSRVSVFVTRTGGHRGYVIFRLNSTYAPGVN